MTVAAEGLGTGGQHDQCLSVSYRTIFFFFFEEVFVWRIMRELTAQEKGNESLRHCTP